MSIEEKLTLINRRKNKDRIILKPDKGSLVKIMNTNYYINEGYRQFNDDNRYEYLLSLYNPEW